MWPSLFDDDETKASFERLRICDDERMAFMVAAVDGAFRKRIRTGSKPPEAYARSVDEIAKMNALVEGYSLSDSAKREEQKNRCTQRRCAKDLMIRFTRKLNGFSLRVEISASAVRCPWRAGGSSSR